MARKVDVVLHARRHRNVGAAWARSHSHGTIVVDAELLIRKRRVDEEPREDASYWRALASTEVRRQGAACWRSAPYARWGTAAGSASTARARALEHFALVVGAVLILYWAANRLDLGLGEVGSALLDQGAESHQVEAVTDLANSR